MIRKVILLRRLQIMRYWGDCPQVEPSPTTNICLPSSPMTHPTEQQIPPSSASVALCLTFCSWLWKSSAARNAAWHCRWAKEFGGCADLNELSIFFWWGRCDITEKYLNEFGRMWDFINMSKSYYDGYIMATKQAIRRIHGKESSKTLWIHLLSISKQYKTYELHLWVIWICRNTMEYHQIQYPNITLTIIHDSSSHLYDPQRLHCQSTPGPFRVIACRSWPSSVSCGLRGPWPWLQVGEVGPELVVDIY